MEVFEVTLDTLSQITPLFDGYMVFYGQPSIPEKYGQYLHARIKNNEAHVLGIRREDGKCLGFTLLYPSFSSVSQQRIYVLNDLFVDPDHRSAGVGSVLLDAAVRFARRNGAIRIHLETAVDNLVAQELYNKKGWKKEDDFIHYYYQIQ